MVKAFIEYAHENGDIPVQVKNFGGRREKD